MPQTQLSAKSGSDNSIFGLKEYKKTPKSRFDFSKKVYTTLDIGAVVPIDWFDVYPGDRVKLSIRYLLDTFPLEVPPFTTYTIRTHWYFTKKSALWKGWNTFITRGRSGNIDLQIPSISSSDLISSYQDADGKYINLAGPNSLLNYLGLKPYNYNNDGTKPSYLPYLKADTDSFTTTGHQYTTKVSALPFMNYQKICRNAYMPTNLLQDNHVWFPEDMEDPWYIDYSGSNLVGRLFVPESATMPQSGFIRNFVPSADSEIGDNVVDLLQLRYAPFERDYFVDAKPWLVRGEEQSIDFPLRGTLFAEFLDAAKSEGVTQEDLNGVTMTSNSEGFNPSYATLGNGSKSTQGSSLTLNTATGGNVVKIYQRLGVNLAKAGSRLQLSANTLRNLLAMSVLQERNTLCDGSYRRLVQVHWNETPKVPDYEPMYLGGTSDIVNFGQVVQQSSSVSGSPLGTKAGYGSANNGSSVFTFDSSDYGMIMGVIIISPDVTYSDGIGHEWTDLTYDEQMQPEFANLGYQPILNQEIFPQNSDTYDQDLFGYQTRYAYLKMRLNQTSGLFDLTPSQDSIFGPFVQSRRFSSLPELSAQFVTMSPQNIDRSFLSYTNLPAFKLQFATDVDLVRALPYQSTPETFGF